MTENEACNGKGTTLGGSAGDASASHLIAVALDALAETRACSPAEVSAESGISNGDIIMDSLEAVCVVAALEDHLGRKLPGMEDLGADQLTSIHSIVGLVSVFLASSHLTSGPGTSIAS